MAFKVDMAKDLQMLMDVTEQLDKILFDDYVKRKSGDVASIIRKGVLGGTVNWYEAPKPTGEFTRTREISRFKEG
jgi:exocyst complex component 2